MGKKIHTAGTAQLDELRSRASGGKCDGAQTYGSNTAFGLRDRSQRFLLATQGTTLPAEVSTTCASVLYTKFSSLSVSHTRNYFTCGGIHYMR